MFLNYNLLVPVAVCLLALPQPNNFQGDRKEQKIQLECPFYVLSGYFNLKKKKLFIVSMSMFYIGSDNVKVHRAMGKVPGH